jgi:hypothetical protein
VGLSAATLVQRFGTKRDLLLAADKRGIDLWVGALDRSTATSPLARVVEGLVLAASPAGTRSVSGSTAATISRAEANSAPTNSSPSPTAAWWPYSGSTGAKPPCCGSGEASASSAWPSCSEWPSCCAWALCSAWPPCSGRPRCSTWPARSTWPAFLAWPAWPACSSPPRPHGRPEDRRSQRCRRPAGQVLTGLRNG